MDFETTRRVKGAYQVIGQTHQSIPLNLMIAGAKAREAGKPIDACPYKAGSGHAAHRRERFRWRSGWKIMNHAMGGKEVAEE